MSLFVRVGPSPDHFSGEIVSWCMNEIASRGQSFPAAADKESSPVTAEESAKASDGRGSGGSLSGKASD